MTASTAYPFGAEEPSSARTMARRLPASVLAISAAKAGAGATGLAAHVATALLHMGLTVGVLDLDTRERGLTRWLARRARRVESGETSLVLPAAPLAPPSRARTPEEREEQDVARLPVLFEAMADACDVLVVDTGPGDTPLARQAWSCASVLITLCPESVTDVDMLFEHDEAGDATARPSAYVRATWRARARRAERWGTEFDWILARARAVGDERVRAALNDRFVAAERLLGARRGPRIAEDAAWRVCLEDGLTALDAPPQAALVLREAVRDVVIAARLKGLEGAALTF